MNLNSNIWALPTAARLLADIRKDLSVGVSLCIVMTDRDGPVEFQRALKYSLETDECLTTFSLDLSSLTDATIASIQAAVLGESRRSSLDEFIRNEAPDVILVKGLEDISAPMRGDVLAFIRCWVERCHTNGDVKSLCLIVPGDHTDEIQDLRSSTRSSRINIRCLVGVPSALDVQLLSRAHLLEDLPYAEARWREQIISSLCGNDLELADLLGQSKLDTYDSIYSALEEYATLNSWNRAEIEKKLQKWVPLASGLSPEVLGQTENIKLLWMKITVYTLEHGEEIHPAILTLLQREDDIKHRIWRAQATLALPVIDELRIKIYSLLADRLTNTWGHHDIPEIGEIKYSLERLSMHSWERKQYYEVVRHAREVRNKLAHMDVISLYDYTCIWDSWQRIRRSGKTLAG